MESIRQKKWRAFWKIEETNPKTCFETEEQAQTKCENQRFNEAIRLI